MVFEYLLCAWHCSEGSLSDTSSNSHNQLQNSCHPCVILNGLRHGCQELRLLYEEVTSGVWIQQAGSVHCWETGESDFMDGVWISPRPRFLEHSLKLVRYVLSRWKSVLPSLLLPLAWESHLLCLCFSPQGCSHMGLANWTFHVRAFALVCCGWCLSLLPWIA